MNTEDSYHFEVSRKEFKDACIQYLELPAIVTSSVMACASSGEGEMARSEACTCISSGFL